MMTSYVKSICITFALLLLSIRVCIGSFYGIFFQSRNIQCKCSKSGSGSCSDCNLYANLVSVLHSIQVQCFLPFKMNRWLVSALSSRWTCVDAVSQCAVQTMPRGLVSHRHQQRVISCRSAGVDGRGLGHS